ncbi:MAG: DUF3604 domain-containing protein, partial [Anaerolineae bacterium]
MSHSLLWGDLHNHNAVGYARGSLERAIDIATEHLDFFSFTGHAQWHDMPRMPQDAHMKWVKGFEVMRAAWPDVQRQIQAANRRDDFTAFLGYEWHSSRFGDYCLYYPDDEGDLVYADHIAELKAHARSEQALLIPHHPAYKRGVRGIDWRYLDLDLSPVAEIYSEHGASERDRGPYPFIRHSNGGRWTGNTVQSGLAEGLRLGIVASTDDHLGYPGAYGEGLMGIWAGSNTRTDILEAIKSRRTYGVTGDRIKLWFQINDASMGAELPFCEKRRIAVDVEGWDEIDRIELVKRNRVVRRSFPVDQEPLTATGPWPERVRVRIQYGWGPWADLGMARIADWDLSASLSEGTITAYVPCFQSGPFDEDRRDRVIERDEQTIRWQSFTSRRQAFAEDPTKAMLLEVAAPGDAQLTITARRQVHESVPGGCEITCQLSDLVDRNRIA